MSSEQLMKTLQLNYAPVWCQVVNYVLSNGGMILAFQGQNHTYGSLGLWNNRPRSLWVQYYAGGQILVGIFQKLTASTL